MPDERKCRRPDWVEGTPITLEQSDDGAEQVWHFPKPTREFRIRTGGLSVGVSPVETNRRFGPRFWSLQAEMQAAVEVDVQSLPEGEVGRAMEAQYRAIAAVAVDLLSRNYDAPDDDLVDLLPVIPNDDHNREIWEAIYMHAMGIAPKPLPAGNA